MNNNNLQNNNGLNTQNTNNSLNNNLNTQNYNNPPNNNGLNPQNNNYVNQNLEFPNNVNNSLNKNLTTPNAAFNNKIQYNNNLNTNINTNNENTVQKQVSSKSKTILILSIINIIIIVPNVALFGGIWLLFGAFGSRSTYYTLLTGCGIYILLSIIILIKSIWDVVKYNNKSKIGFIIAIIVIIISILGMAFLIKIYPDSDSNRSNSHLNNNQGAKLKNNTLLVTNDIEIKVTNVIYTYRSVEVHFNLNNKSNKFYNFNIYQLKVNDSDNVYYGIEPTSNFHSATSYVEPYNNSNDYVMYISYKDLENYHIRKNDIKTLSFKIVLYASERGDVFFNQINNDEYLTIELK